MSPVEDDLRRVLAARAADVEPQLTPESVRRLAALREEIARRRRERAVPVASAVLAAAVVLTALVLPCGGGVPQHVPPAAPFSSSVVAPATPAATPRGGRPAPTTAVPVPTAAESTPSSTTPTPATVTRVGGSVTATCGARLGPGATTASPGPC